jgi:glycosyltransferase involved in cell wall biosynthesis
VNLIRKNNIKLAHAYQASFGAGAAWLLKLFQKKLTFALTLQEGKDFSKQSRIINFFRKLIIRKADAITAISDYLAKYAKSFNKKAKVIVIPNGVDFNLFKTVKDDEKIPESLGIKKDERILITTSRLVPKNGLMDLIEAMGILKKEIPQIKLLIIGSGSLLGKMKKKSELLGLKNDILFLGEIENSKLPEYLRTADIFVRPSLSEGLGNSFLEAMAVGVPIIGTPVGGIIDFLIDGKTGIFCRPHDPRSIADAVMKILSDKQLNELLIKNGQELIGEKYDWQIIAGKFNDFYHDLGIY